jgi:PEP-CTERM motif
LLYSRLRVVRLLSSCTGSSLTLDAKKRLHIMPRPAVCVLRVLIGCSIAVLFTGRPAAAGPIVAGVWYQFAFTDAGISATGCFPDDPAGNFCIPSSGTPTTFADAPPWTFVAAAPTTLTVTDAFVSGDQFEILDFGMVIGMTSPPIVGGAVDCGDDPVICLATAGMSTGVFALGAGAHSLVIVPLLSEGAGAAYFQIPEAIPEPTTVLLLTTGIAAAALRRRRRSR